MTKEIELVMDYERKQGRSPKDVSRKYLGYDIESDGRLIEVKKRSARYSFLYMTKNEFLTFQRNKNSYLYLVYYKDGAPKLKILDRDFVLEYSRISVHHLLRWRKKALEDLEEIGL